MKLVTVAYTAELTKDEAKIFYDAECLLKELNSNMPDVSIGQLNHHKTAFNRALNELEKVNKLLNVLDILNN